MASIEYVLHRRWVPRDTPTYGKKYRGMVIFRLLGRLLEVRYDMYDDLISLHSRVLGSRSEGAGYYTPNEISFSFPEDQIPNSKDVEYLVEQELVPVLVMCIDGGV